MTKTTATATMEVAGAQREEKPAPQREEKPALQREEKPAPRPVELLVRAAAEVRRAKVVERAARLVSAARAARSATSVKVAKAAKAGGMGGMGGDTPTCDPVTLPGVFIGELSGTQEVPANTSSGTGASIAELNELETQVTVSVYYSGLSSNTAAGHIHGPAAPGANAADRLRSRRHRPLQWRVRSSPATFPITPTQVAQLKGGQLYTNIHSMNFPNGEIRAQLLPAAMIRSGTLSGDEEVPANSSPGTGRAMAVLFPSATRAVVSVTYSGLTGPATADTFTVQPRRV